MGLSVVSHGFYYVLLNTLFDLQDDEIDQSITDNSYAAARGRTPTRDRGIDAIVIDEKIDPPSVHLLNCKYSAVFENTRSFFPSNEVDKVLTFFADLMGKEPSLVSDVTAALHGKVTEVWNLFDRTNPRFILHFCSNFSEGLTVAENARLSASLATYSNISCEVHTQNSLATRIAGKGRRRVDAKVKAVHKNVFEKSGGDIRALVAHIEGLELIRCLCADQDLRLDVSAARAALVGVGVCEDVFDDNVRIYLQHRSKVNRNIKATAESDESVRFFYFNNGITIICDRFRYPTGQSGPIIELTNLQVVNGGQTIHALFEAFADDPAHLERIDILCRIYETTDADLSSKIAERTNTQTPVKTRDIRSIDIVQIKLEREFKALGLFYERKKNQHAKQAKKVRVDAEKCGQVALAFYHELPLEAKNKKQVIFGDMYEELFSEDTNAHQLLLPLRLFEFIEQQKPPPSNARSAWLRYASYHILYAIKLIAVARKTALDFANLDKMKGFYGQAKLIVSRARRAAIKAQGDLYEDVLFFKSSEAKNSIRELVSVPVIQTPKKN